MRATNKCPYRVSVSTIRQGIAGLLGFFGACLVFLIVLDAFERHPMLVLGAAVLIAPAAIMLRNER